MTNFDEVKKGDVYHSLDDKRMRVEILSIDDKVYNGGFNTYYKTVKVKQIFDSNVPDRVTSLSAREGGDGNFYFFTIL